MEYDLSGLSLASPEKDMSLAEAFADRICTSQDAVTLAFIYRTDPIHGSFVQPWKLRILDKPHRTLDSILDCMPRPNSQPNFDDQIVKPPTTSKEHDSRVASAFADKPISQNFPLEIFEQILPLVSHHDAQQMRLVCRDWEHKVSGYLFRSVVIPFSTEIYTTAKPYALQLSQVSRAAGKSCQGQQTTKDMLETNDQAVPDPNRSGIDMFSSFGPYMRQFGIRFEVDETTLADPPSKFLQSGYDSYWGPYAWPLKEYPRFADRASLEVTADETATMAHAFAKLEQVTELALAIDCGLGHLLGQDKSIRSRFLRNICPIFSPARFAPGPQVDLKRQLWELVKLAFGLAMETADIRCATMIRVADPRFKNDILEMAKDNQAMPWYSVEPDILTQARNDRTYLDNYNCPIEPTSPNSAYDEWGILIVRSIHSEEEAQQGYEHTLVPKALSRMQTEWLLETAWAQDAFLSSYVLSVADNREAFVNVSRLTLSRLSSRHFTALMRKEFWDALPVLEIFEIHVIADYQEVSKDSVGMAQTRSVRRAYAVDRFHDLIEHHLACKESIKTLVIGWVEGGEHAQGVTARGKHVLPAPLSTGVWFLHIDDSATGDLIVLPSVQRLVLRNCWLTPNVLRAIILSNTALQLTSLVLDSVSLTCHPRAPAVMGQFDGNEDDHALAIVGNAQPNYHEAPEIHDERGGRFLQTLHLQDRSRPRSIGSLTTRRSLLSATSQPPVREGLRESALRIGSWQDVLDSVNVDLASIDMPLDDYTGFSPSSSSTARAQPHKLNIKLLSAGYAFLPHLVRVFHQPLFARIHRTTSRPRRGRGSDWIEEHLRLFQAWRDTVLANAMSDADETLEAVLLNSWPDAEMDSLLARYTPYLYSGWPHQELASSITPGNSPSTFGKPQTNMHGSPQSLAEADEALWGRWSPNARDAPRFDGMLPGGSGRFSGEIDVGFGINRSRGDSF